jgi:hypothetical protein
VEALPPHEALEALEAPEARKAPEARGAPEAPEAPADWEISSVSGVSAALKTPNASKIQVDPVDSANSLASSVSSVSEAPEYAEPGPGGSDVPCPPGNGLDRLSGPPDLTVRGVPQP